MTIVSERPQTAGPAGTH